MFSWSARAARAVVALFVVLTLSLGALAPGSQATVPERAGTAFAAAQPADAEPGFERVVTLNRETGSYGTQGPGRYAFAGSEVFLEGVNRRFVAVEVRPDRSRPGPRDTYRLTFSIDQADAWVEGRTYRMSDAPGRSAGWPGTIAFNVDSSSCAGSHGEFTVHEMAEDLSRFRISYAVSCGSGWNMTYGEVRWGVDDRAEHGMSVSRAAHWPDAEVGEVLRGGGVLVSNHSAEPVATGRPYVTGPQAAEFFAIGQCGVLASGASCYPEVALRPTGPGLRQAVWHLPLAGTDSELRVPLRVFAFGGVTRWHTVQARADGRRTVVRGGSELRLVIGDNFNGGPPYHQQLVSIGAHDHGGPTASFSSPQHEPLTVGHYAGAQRGPHSGSAPGIRIDAPYLHCPDDLDAEFDVHQLDTDDDGEVSAFAVSFVHRCAGDTTRGYIAFRAREVPRLRNAPEVAISAPRTSYRARQVVPVTVTTSLSGRPGLLEVRAYHRGRFQGLARHRVPPSGVLTLPHRMRRAVRLDVKLADEPWTATRSLRLKLIKRRR